MRDQINNREEIWWNVNEPGFTGLYKVSNKGRVKSVKNIKPRILKASRSVRGHLQVHLRHMSLVKSLKVHRLVADAFVPPSKEGYTCVKHINGDKTDNRAENLKWYSRSRRFDQFDKNNKFIRTYDSVKDVMTATGVSPNNLYDCCKQVKKTAGGFIWRIHDETVSTPKLPKHLISLIKEWV
jgi:hypothetical protein